MNLKMENLKDKIILVTGGSGLIGKSIVDQILKEKGLPISLDIYHEDLTNPHNYKCDITNNSDVINTIEKVLNKFKTIDGLVNNAYPKTSDWGKTFDKIPYDSWKKNLDLQLNSMFFISQKILKIMKNQKKGSIVNIGSIYGSVGPDFSIYEGTDLTMPAAYSVIKGGVINFTKYLASLFGKYNINVNCVSPGGVYNNQSSKFVNKYIKRVPMKRMAYPSDISPAITFLLSDNAKYINGQNLIIDGGLTSI